MTKGRAIWQKPPLPPCYAIDSPTAYRLQFLKTYLPHVLFIQPFIVTMTDEHREYVITGAMQDGVDGIVTGDILYLATAEIVLRCQCMHI